MNETLKDRLQDVLDLVWQIRPSLQDPINFHEARSEVVGRLKSLIATVDDTTLAARTRVLPVHRIPIPTPAPAPTPSVTEDIAMNEAPADPPVADGVVHDVVSADDATVIPTPDPAPADTPLLEPVSPNTSSPATPSDEFIALHELLVDLERRLLALADTVASQAATPPTPPEPPEPSDPSKDPPTLFRRALLTTEAGQRIAATLWMDGLTVAEIACCFDYRDTPGAPVGSACVAAGIAQFIRANRPDAEWGDTAAARRDLVQQILRPVADRPAPPVAVLPAPASTPASAPAATPQQPTTLRPIGKLNTAKGRAKAAELWVDGHRQRDIGVWFGFSENSAAAQVSLAVSQFIHEQLTLTQLNVAGEERKALARDALAVWHNGGQSNA
jgi:hypothetical protein